MTKLCSDAVGHCKGRRGGAGEGHRRGRNGEAGSRARGVVGCVAECSEGAESWGGRRRGRVPVVPLGVARKGGKCVATSGLGFESGKHAACWGKGRPLVRCGGTVAVPSPKSPVPLPSLPPASDSARTEEEVGLT